MTTKTYFVKVSWTDPEQRLRRVHQNDVVELDLGAASWAISQESQKQICGYKDVDEFTVDFMIEVPSA